MNMNAIDMLLLFDTTFESFIPQNLHVWIDNNRNEIIDNDAQLLVFNVP